MKKLHALGCTLLLALPLAACKGQGNPPAADDAGTMQEESAASKASPSTPAGKYSTKSGVIEWKADLFGETSIVLYFDDYGAKQASYTTTTVSMFGQTSTTNKVEITVDGWTTSFDPDEGTGVRRRGSGSGLGGMPTLPDAKELAQLKAEDRKRYGFEELPARTIFGKEARGYAMSAMGMKIRGWSWENIPMRLEADMGGKEPMVMEIARLDLGAPVPADKFAVPAGLEITEW